MPRTIIEHNYSDALDVHEKTSAARETFSDHHASVTLFVEMDKAPCVRKVVASDFN